MDVKRANWKLGLTGNWGYPARKICGLFRRGCNRLDQKGAIILTTARRITLAIYLVILAANFVWVPWRSTEQVRPHRALGSGLVWRGPVRARMSGPFTEPDIRLILLRSLAITTLGLG